MGVNKIRIVLTSRNAEPLTVSVDPIGLNEFEIELKRSDKNDAVFFEFTIALDFVKDAKAYLENEFEIDGPDAEVFATFYVDNPNIYRPEVFFSGQVDLTDNELKELSIRCNVEKTSFERKFLNQLEIDVDLETPLSQGGLSLPATNTLNQLYHAKSILKRLDVSPTDENEFSQPSALTFNFGPVEIGPGIRPRDVTVFGQIDTGSNEARELDENFTYFWGFGDDRPGEHLRATEGGTGDLDISLRLKHSVIATQTGASQDIDAEPRTSGLLGFVEIKAIYEHLSVDDQVKDVQEFGEWTTTTLYDGDNYLGDFETKTLNIPNITVEVGDKIFAYYSVRVFADYELAGQGPGGGDRQIVHEMRVEADLNNTWVRLNLKTEVPASTSKSIFVYEAFEKLCQYITDQQDCFRSEFFGRTDTSFAYAEDGAGALNIITNGRALRNLDTQQIFATFEDLFESMNAIYCLSWGFETLDNGTRIVRIEPKSYFRDKTTTVLNLGRGSETVKVSLASLYYSQVEIGYPTIENINQINGIDEFNTIRRYRSGIVNSDKKLTIQSVYRTSGFEIESQRRLRGSTEESRLDEENFITAVLRSGSSPTGIITEQATEFDFVNNVFDFETSYNLRLAPGYMIQNWKEILGSTVIRSADKSFKFTYGEGNYEMESQLTGGETIVENGDVDTSDTEPFYYNEDWRTQVPLTFNEFTILLAQPYGLFRFTDWGRANSGFLQSCKFTSAIEKANFTLRRDF